jgi:hypothetical protein
LVEPRRYQRPAVRSGCTLGVRGEFLPQLRIRENKFQFFCQCSMISRIEQNPIVTVDDYFSQPADSRSDYGRPCRHRFEANDGQSFGSAGWQSN